MGLCQSEYPAWVRFYAAIAAIRQPHERLRQLDFGMRIVEGNRVCYDSVVRKRAITRGGRFPPEFGAAIHGLLCPVAVAIVLIGIANFCLVKK
jgi:hypothetical protein